MQSNTKPATRAKQPLDQALESFDSMPDAAFVRTAVVVRLFDCSRATLWRRLRAAQIPAPLAFSPKDRRWNVGDLRKYLADPIAFSRSGHPQT